MARITARQGNTTPAAALSAVMEAERALLAARKELEEVNSPRLPRPSTSVIRFAKRFAGGSKIYDYAAIKTGGDGHWYVTGADSERRTWERMSEFICSDNTLEPSYVELFDQPDELPF